MSPFSRPPVVEALIVGLGNPGEEYAHTRHNAGFQCLGVLARRQHLSFREKRSRARIAVGAVAGRPVVLARPYTFMNRSGAAVAGLLHWLGLPPARLLVVYDDLDLPAGTIRLRARGGAAGHKGMASILEALGTEEFPRLRMGIGRPADPALDPVDYVLLPFTAREEAAWAPVLERAADAVECFLREGIVAAMDRFNRVVEEEMESRGKD
jgi:PTH1 family peptidyl-tRNA hydrolase